MGNGLVKEGDISALDHSDGRGERYNFAMEEPVFCMASAYLVSSLISSTIGNKENLWNMQLHQCFLVMYVVKIVCVCC